MRFWIPDNKNIQFLSVVPESVIWFWLISIAWLIRWSQRIWAFLGIVVFERNGLNPRVARLERYMLGPSPQSWLDTPTLIDDNTAWLIETLYREGRGSAERINPPKTTNMQYENNGLVWNSFILYNISLVSTNNIEITIPYFCKKNYSGNQYGKKTKGAKKIYREANTTYVFECIYYYT